MPLAVAFMQRKLQGGYPLYTKVPNFFFFFLEVAYISVSHDRFISVSSDSLGLQKIFHHQREIHVSTGRFAIEFLLLDSKAQLIALI